MVIGHRRITDFLKKSAANNRLAHAYLFTGPSGIGKRTVALEFVKMLTGKEINQGINPDVLIVEPIINEKDGVKKEMEIGIEDARKIQRQMSLSPYAAPYKIALIDKAEMLTAAASNCLLKTLEEPSGQAVLILITVSPQALLPTIVSRCQLIKFLPVSEKEMKKGLLQASDRIIRLANGRPGLAIRYLQDGEVLKNQNKIISRLKTILSADLNEKYRLAETMSKNTALAREILGQWLFWFRDLLLLNMDRNDLLLYADFGAYRNSYSTKKLKEIIKAIRKTNYLLTNPSLNARLALEVLMLEF